jgi:lysophospholipase L1-like esterase
MARSVAGEHGKAARLALALAGFFVLTASVAAEDAVGPGTLPPLSPACDVPPVDIASPAPLARVAASLHKGGSVRILAIGSSSTYGIGASSGVKSYPSQLSDILAKAMKDVTIEVVNRGIGGEVAETTAARIHNEVALARPDLVLWQLGTNDALARVDPDQFEQTVRSTVDWLKANQIDVVLVGLQYTPRFAKDKSYFAILEVLRKIAAEENVLYVRRYDAMQFIAKTRANEQMMSSDNFHLNDLGYQCMAEHVAHAVIINLFVKRFRPAPDSGP